MKITSWSLLPDFYSTKEGGKLLEWRHGRILPGLLDQRGPVTVTVKGQSVHMLTFEEDPHAPMKRWDCVNGWTPAIYEMTKQT